MIIKELMDNNKEYMAYLLWKCHLEKHIDSLQKELYKIKKHISKIECKALNLTSAEKVKEYDTKREKQDKIWNDLSVESKFIIQDEWLKLAIEEEHDDLDIKGAYKKLSLENIFGIHNLKLDNSDI